MKRVLIISYYWPPSGGSGVQRWLKFTKYLPQFGWTPVVYTPENPEISSTDITLLKDISPKTEVLKREILEPYSFYKRISGKKEKKIEANFIAKRENRSFVEKLSLFIRANIFIPDPRMFWIDPSVKYLQKYLKENPVDLIVSSGPPHSMHLIAKKLSKQTGIKWIADFRDPWTEIFYFKHLKMLNCSRKRHRRLEQSVFDGADLLITVSDKIKSDFNRATQTEVEVITNGFDPEDFKEASKPKEVKNDKFCLTHTGLFTQDGNPDNLWDILGKKAAKESHFKESLLIRLMGQTDATIIEQIERAGLKENCQNLGYVSHTDVVKWQQEASVLLLPLRKEPEAGGILTGKFFEYLASKREILAFGPIDGDLAKALKESGAGSIYNFEDRDGVAAAIERLYQEHRENRLQTIESNIEQYSRVTLTKRLAELFDRLTK